MSIIHQFDAVENSLKAGVYSKNYDDSLVYQQAQETVKEIKDELQNVNINLKLLCSGVLSINQLVYKSFSSPIPTDLSVKDNEIKMHPTKYNIMMYVANESVEDPMRENIKTNVYPIIASGYLHATLLLVHRIVRLKGKDTEDNILIKTLLRSVLSLWVTMLEVPYDTFDDELNELPLLVFFLCERDRFGSDILWQHKQLLLMPLFFSSLEAFIREWHTLPVDFFNTLLSISSIVLSWYPTPRVTVKAQELCFIARSSLIRVIPTLTEGAFVSALTTLENLTVFSLPSIHNCDSPITLTVHYLLILSGVDKQESCESVVTFHRCPCTCCEWRRNLHKIVADGSTRIVSDKVVSHKDDPRRVEDCQSTLLKRYDSLSLNEKLMTIRVCCSLFSLSEKTIDETLVQLIRMGTELFEEIDINQDSPDYIRSIVLAVLSSIMIVLRIIYLSNFQYDAFLADGVSEALLNLNEIVITKVEECEGQAPLILVPLMTSTIFCTMICGVARVGKSLESIKFLREPDGCIPTVCLSESLFKRAVKTIVKIFEDLDANRLRPVKGIYSQDVLASSAVLMSILSGNLLIKAVIPRKWKGLIPPPHCTIGSLGVHSTFITSDHYGVPIMGPDEMSAEDERRRKHKLGDEIIQERRDEFGTLMHKKCCPMVKNLMISSNRRIEKAVGIVNIS